MTITLALSKGRILDDCLPLLKAVGIELEEESGGAAAGIEVRGIVAAEGLNTGGALEAADIAVVHGGGVG